MATFYDRTETENEIVITYKYHAAAWILIFGGFAVAYIGPYTGLSKTAALAIVLGILFIVFIYILGKISPNREIRKAMKLGRVQVSGSKFSFSNPLTFRIKK